MDDEQWLPRMAVTQRIRTPEKTGGFPKTPRRCAEGKTRAPQKLANAGWMLFFIGAWLSGCTRPQHPVEPVFVRNPTLGVMTIAVAPALNLSGSLDFDRNRFADLMAMELSYADGITVIPVSRVLGVLSAQGREAVESPEHAGRLAQTLGANAILVFAVTRYDPYDPPSIGITAQLYGARAVESGGPIAPSEVAAPNASSAGDQRSDSTPLLAQTSAVHDAAHAAVAQDIAEFARQRSADNSPFGWRKYVVSQQGFIQYCCYVTIHSLLSGESRTAAVENQRER